MKNFKYFLALAPLLVLEAAIAEWNFESETTLSGVYRDYRKGSSELDNIREGFFESNTGIDFSKGNFQMEAKALVRSIQSPANENRNDPARIDLTPPRRAVRAFAFLNDEESSNQTIVDIGSLWGSYSFENVQVSAGRRPIGIGVLKVIPVWNRLYPVLPTLSGYMLVNNPDMADIRWTKDKWTIASYHIVSQYYDDSISALEFIHYGEKLESHFLFSKWWNQPTAGYSGVVDTELGIFRLESLGVAKAEADTQSGFQIGVGWEKAITEKLSLLTEYYHSTFGTNDPDEYLFQDTTPFRALLATDYFYPQVIYKLTDFTANELGTLYNAIDQSFMVINKTTYSYSDNVDFYADVRYPVGGSKQEFGHLNVPMTQMSFEYVRWVSVGLKINI